MDIYCVRCGEPMDVSELHDFENESDESLSFNEAKRIFSDPDQGCGVLYNFRPCALSNSLEAEASSALFDLLGDDIDGIAAVMDDYNFLFN